jgi:hypothetical protein
VKEKTPPGPVLMAGLAQFAAAENCPFVTVSTFNAAGEAERCIVISFDQNAELQERRVRRIAERHFNLIESERTCRVCGCSDEDACVTEPNYRGNGIPIEGGNCFWVDSDLCSACVPMNEEAQA